MEDHQSKWMRSMVAKLGSEEAVKEFMSENGRKPRKPRSRPGYFKELKDLDPERLKEISKDGSSKRWADQDQA